MKPTDLRGILHYTSRFRDTIFVIGLDGAVVRHDFFSVILTDIAVLRSLNIRVVLVHGASAQIRSFSEQQGVSISNADGTGITDHPTLQLSITAANRVTHEILQGLAANDLHAAVTNAIVAHPLGILKGVDYLHTGKVEKVNGALLQTLLSHNLIPVLPPLGFNGEGNTFRVDSHRIALAVAQALKATKLIFITESDGLYYKQSLIRQLSANDLDAMLKSGPQGFDAASHQKAAIASQACHSGIPRAHFINGLADEGLLSEVFSNEGVGTLIYANEYQQIRPARKKDIRNIQRLTENSVRNEELVKRTKSMIESHLEDYYIFEIDKNPIACVALHRYPDDQCGELACLCVDPGHENQGIGQKLINFVIHRATELGCKKLLAASTQTFNYFVAKGGFQLGSADDLPQARRALHEKNRRQAKILVKQLGP